MRRLILLFPIALLAACGGSSKEPSQGGEVLRTISISEKEFSLSPAGLTLGRAGTYEFEVTNDGQTTHALELDGNGVEESTGDIEPGSSKILRVTLSDSGSYEMYCPIGGHKDQGMKGSVVVGNAAGGGEDTTTDDEKMDTGRPPGY
jgi:PQQ system protein